MIGFSEVFDAAYGNPNTPRPYPRVTPSCVGAALLPFPCPHCGAVRCEPIHPKKSEGYRDRERGFSWCPSCDGRYVLNRAGAPLVGTLPRGALHAPAVVERGGKRIVVGLHEEDGLTLMGVA